MARLLAIETSSAQGSLALLEGPALLEEAVFPEGLVHGRELTVHLEGLMARLGLDPRSIQAIAVGVGPGSYTGIRVGVTAAKTLALALRAPLLARSSLEVIAAAALGSGAGPARQRPVVPVIDGKQRHLYLARFRSAPGPGGEAALLRETEDRVVEVGRPPLASEARALLEEVASPGALLVGDAADLLLELLAGRAGGLVRGAREWDAPRAARLGALCASAALPPFDAEVIHALVPVYLRPSEAERLHRPREAAGQRPAPR